MSEPKVEQKTEAAAPKKTVNVTAEGGVTFARKHYAKGATIECTAAQEKILQQHGVI